MKKMDMIDALSWNIADQGLQGQLDREFDIAISGLMQVFLCRLEKIDPTEAAKLSSELAMISKSRRTRLLTRAPVSATLRYLAEGVHPDSSLAGAAALLRYWARLENDPFAVAAEDADAHWTVDGSRCYNPDFYMENLKDYFHKEGDITYYVAPKLEDRTVVDFFHPVLWKHIDAGINEYQEHTDGEIAYIRSCIDDSMTALGNVPAAKDFFLRYTDCAHFRQTPSKPNIGSSTNFLRIGSCFFRNIRQDNCPAFNLAELLLHESIHNMLGKYEFLYEPFIGRLDPRRSLVESPWTGNIIPTMAYGQACYVWFGLWAFWREVTDRVANSAVAHRKRLQAAFGFLKPGSMMAPFSYSKAMPSERFLEDCLIMQSVVKAAEADRLSDIKRIRRENMEASA